MLPRVLVCTMLLGILALLAGCGGSASGGGGGTTPTQPQPTAVKFAFNGATPTAVATQIGSGAFTPATPSSGSVTLSLPSGTTSFAVAYVCPPFAQDSTTFVYEQLQEATTSNGTSFAGVCPIPDSAGQTGSLAVNVDASAIPDVSYLNVDAYNGQNFASLFASGSVVSSTLAAPAGTDDVYALAYTVPGGGNPPVLVAAKLLSAQTVPGSLNGGSTVELDAADEVTQEPITYFAAYGTVSSFPSSSISYFPKGSRIGINLGLSLASEYPALPSSVFQPGGVYVLSTGSFASVSGGYSSVRADLTFSGGPQAVTFPAAWSFSAPTPAALPTLETNYAGFAGMAGVTDDGSISWQPDSSSMNHIFVTATENYQNGATSISFPDLSSLPDFLASPPSGATVRWQASVSRGDIGNDVTGYLANTSVQGVSNGGSFTVP